MIDYIKNIDKELFLFLNGLHSDFFDTLMWWISDKFIWIPFYVFLLFMIIKKYGKKSIILIITIALLVTLTDQLSVHLFKDVFKRYRPSHNIDIANLVHIVSNYKGGMYGFVSSHAASSFGIAAIISLFLKKKNITITLFVWATIVSYSRIYLGVHYPADVICGGLLGVFIAFVLYMTLKHANVFKDFK